MTDILASSSAQLITFFLIIAVAGLVHGTLGLGFPMTATPLLALFMDVRSAVLITLLPTVAVNLVSILRGGQWRTSIGRYWRLAAYVPLGAIVGTYLLLALDPAPFKLLLAGIILLYLNLDRLQAAPLSWISRRPQLAYLVFGVGAGLLAGTVNVMVPLLIIYALERGLASTAMVQVFNLCFLAGKLAQLVTFSLAGAFSLEAAVASGPLAVAAVVALLVGMAVRARVAADTYRAWLRKVLFVIALILMVQFVLML